MVCPCFLEIWDLSCDWLKKCTRYIKQSMACRKYMEVYGSTWKYWIICTIFETFGNGTCFADFGHAPMGHASRCTAHRAIWSCWCRSSKPWRAERNGRALVRSKIPKQIQKDSKLKSFGMFLSSFSILFMSFVFYCWKVLLLICIIRLLFLLKCLSQSKLCTGMHLHGLFEYPVLKGSCRQRLSFNRLQTTPWKTLIVLCYASWQLLRFETWFPRHPPYRYYCRTVVSMAFLSQISFWGSTLPPGQYLRGLKAQRQHKANVNTFEHKMLGFCKDMRPASACIFAENHAKQLMHGAALRDWIKHLNRRDKAAEWPFWILTSP